MSAANSTQASGEAHPWRWPVLLLLGAVATAMVFVATPLGVGVGYDSYYYLEGADNLLAGNGFARTLASGDLQPITHFPPFLSGLLALGAGALGTTPQLFGRGLVAVLFGGNLVLAGWFVGDGTGSYLAGILAAFLLMTSSSMVEQHLWAMSEPLYVLLLLMVMTVLVRACRSEDGWLLAFAGTLAGLAYLTRYVGAALVAAAGLFLLSRPSQAWSDRLRRALTFAVPAAVPAIAWLIRNAGVGPGLTNRALLWHPPGLAKVREAAGTLSGWVMPGWGPPELRAVLAALAALAVVALWLRERRWARRGQVEFGRRRHALDALGLHVGVYSLALYFSLTFFDASTRLNDRILLPLYLSLVLMGVLLLAPLAKARVGPLLRSGLIAALLLIFLIPYGSRTLATISSARAVGLGFNSRSWVTSETLSALRELPQGTLIYTNEAFPVSFHTGRHAHPVPERLDPVQGQEREGYPAQLSTMRSRLEAERGALVLFHPENLRVEMPPLEELTAGMTATERLADGTIYRPTDASAGN